MIYLIIILVCVLLYLFVEYRLHQRNVNSIPIRIHINGTRGKSSVTRLISAGLRAGNMKTFGKTTGTTPRMILENGNELPIIRKGPPTILEQIKTVRTAAKRKCTILVSECMAITPEFQWITAQKMIKPTIGVITNARIDHSEMGNNIIDTTKSLANTIPFNKVCITADPDPYKIIQHTAETRNSKFIKLTKEEIESVATDGFLYFEHKDNIALALKVCEQVGVDRDIALQGMRTCYPDTGALRIFQLKFGKKNVDFINAFAANDPESTSTILRALRDRYSKEYKQIIILNSRQDRMSRSWMLIEMLKNEQFDKLYLIGRRTGELIIPINKYNLDKSKIENVGYLTGERFNEIFSNIPYQTFYIIGIGNIGDNGNEIMSYIKNKLRDTH
ncbi:MAG: poly-gamma-glutamate synthase PgsB [Candidatus Cloacimonadota bacterium]|nr:MAG: poly-gamma-glutamate synthase PgsB [Candidatus Cloacimonadota bacterium]